MLQKLMRRLMRDEGGSVFLIAALTAMGVIGSVGIAVDAGRAQMAQNKLQNSLDAAGLAAGSSLNSSDLSGVVNKYLQLNFAQGHLGATITSVTTTLSSDQQVLTASATATLPNTFMQIFGNNTVTLHATTEVTRTNKGMELVLVLDTTGSMADPAGGGLTKIQAAKNAATDLINILYGSGATPSNLWVGLVPFAQAVNIDPSRTSWTQADNFNWGPSPWAGCVDARETSGRDITDDPPSVALFPKYYWADDSNNNWMTTSTSNSTANTALCSNKSSCTCANWGPCTTSVNGNVSTTISCNGFGSNRSCNKAVTTTTTTTTYSISSTRGPNAYCSQAVTPMTSNKTTVLNALTTLAPNGNTHIDLGAAWGWRMLSPRWRGLWGGDMDANSLPQNYNTPMMNKVVILMTDGDNTISNSDRGAYGYLSDGKLGTTNSAAAVTQLNTRTTNVCNSMKQNGILVYTIAFGTDISSTAQNILLNCASGQDYYFYSPTGTDLQTAFHTIGDSLANLRISH